jgi:hypothetical protein
VTRGAIAGFCALMPEGGDRATRCRAGSAGFIWAGPDAGAVTGGGWRQRTGGGAIAAFACAVWSMARPLGVVENGWRLGPKRVGGGSMLMPFCFRCVCCTRVA